MGKKTHNYGKRPVEGERTGSGWRKNIKEMDHGRIARKTVLIQRHEDQKRRLGSLADSATDEQGYKTFTNAILGWAYDICKPEDISRIVRYNSLATPEGLALALDSPNAGKYGAFLPLHHQVKLLAKPVQVLHGHEEKKIYILAPTDRFIFLLGTTTQEEIPYPDLRNARALEYFLLHFTSRLKNGQYLYANIDGHSVAMEKPQKSDWYRDSDKDVQAVRQLLRQCGVGAQDKYFLRKMRDGGYKVPAKVLVQTEQRKLNTFNGVKEVLISYAAIKN